MKSVLILSLIAVFSSQAYAADDQPSPSQMCGAVGLSVMVGSSVGMAMRKDIGAAESIAKATIAGGVACGAAAGATELYNDYQAPDEKDLQEEPVNDSADLAE